MLGLAVVAAPAIGLIVLCRHRGTSTLRRAAIALLGCVLLLVVAALAAVVHDAMTSGQRQIVARTKTAVGEVALLQQREFPFCASRRLLWSRGGNVWLSFYMGHEEIRLDSVTVWEQGNTTYIIGDGHCVAALDTAAGSLAWFERAVPQAREPMEALYGSDPENPERRVSSESSEWTQALDEAKALRSTGR